ncbi:hypothetical protein SSX86_012665 [Deinandra increscens subsp. villosa]|uniref:Late embryogenesis abundant protein LEA-2 subgroup domain-containing protein n=1 Tax=Deinandra increscens subsp. villosa TaxID=3103831 RepID=A0AAP0H3H5_9ASTR
MPPTPAKPHLNSAFYGPPIPPTTKSYHRPGRRTTTTTCNPLTCCFSCICGCILNLICELLITVAIFISVIGLLLWFIFRPNVPKFHVDDVTLTQFTLSPANDTLFYNLAVNLTFRNPNRRLGIYYEQIQADAVYHGLRFSTAEVQGFYLGHKKENSFGAVFKGEQLVAIGGAKSRYDSEKSEDLYRIDLKLRLKMRLKAWWVKTPRFKPKFECDLKVPMRSKGKNSTAEKFGRTKCEFDWYSK